MNNWHVEITYDRYSYRNPEGRWLITGWYEDEKTAYHLAQAEWESKNYHLVDFDEVDLSCLDLNFVDDYFHWHAETPHWYLHNDGLWHRLICDYGEFNSQESAQTMLDNTSTIAPRFENYDEHLRIALSEPHRGTTQE